MRAFCFACLFLVHASTAFAGPSPIVLRDGETADIQRDGIRAFAFREQTRQGLRLTMLFADPDGSVLRSHVNLIDGQRHEIGFENDNDSGAITRFSFERQGNDVLINSVTEPAEATLARND